MRVKIGCDVVHISRFKKVLTRTPLARRRIFLSKEDSNASFEQLAGIFAAKEAVIKALELKVGRWREIEIVKSKNGRPKIKLKRSNRQIINQDISISHDGDYAIAVAIFYVTH